MEQSSSYCNSKTYTLFPVIYLMLEDTLFFFPMPFLLTLVLFPAVLKEIVDNYLLSQF